MSCVPRAALTAHSPSRHLRGLCPCPAGQTPLPDGPTLWSQGRLCCSHTHKIPRTRGVPWSWSHLLLRPRKWGQDCATVLGGGSLWEEAGTCLSSAVQDGYLCPPQSAGLRGAGMVLMLCGQAWPNDWVGRTPLRSQGSTRSVLHALKVSTDRAQERIVQNGNPPSLYLRSPVFQDCSTIWDAWRMMDDAEREKPPCQVCCSAEDGLDSLHLGMLQPRGHSHEWVRWTLWMSELLYTITRSISKASHKHRGASRIPEATGTFHPRLQALCLQVRGVSHGSWPARGGGCPLPGDAENPKLPVQFSLLSL